MADPIDTDWADLGELTWPACDVFSAKPRSDSTSEIASPHSDLKKGHIRLVKIRTGDRDSIIRCHTRIALLESTGQYTALSYTWGSTLPSQPIEIDGRLRLIPKNLWRFLWQARECPQKFSGWIWIDMLSIDQKCAWERTHQVNIMSDIFKNAATVVVWAGPAYGESDKALGILSKAVPANKRTLTRICSGPVCSAIQRSCQRPYWRRLWIFQELKFARNIILMCGEKLLSWPKFQGFMLLARAEAGTPRLKDKVDTFLHSPAGAMVELTLNSLDTSLWALLQATKRLRCAVPHDKVYALLSMTGSGHEGISADYTMPIPVLLNLILRNKHALTPPGELDEVATQCKTLENLFGVPLNTIFIPPALHIPPSEPRVVCYPTAYRLGPTKYPLSLWWTDHYGHDEVQRLLLSEWDYHWFEGNQSPTSEEIYATQAVLTKCCFAANIGPLGDQYLQAAVHANHLAVLKLLLALPDLYADIGNATFVTLVEALYADRTEMVNELLAPGRFDVRGQLEFNVAFWRWCDLMPQSTRDVLENAGVTRPPWLIV